MPKYKQCVVALWKQLFDNFTTWIVENWAPKWHIHTTTTSRSSTVTIAHSICYKPHWMHFIACYENFHQMSFSICRSDPTLCLQQFIPSYGNQSDHFYNLLHARLFTPTCIHCHFKLLDIAFVAHIINFDKIVQTDFTCHWSCSFRQKKNPETIVRKLIVCIFICVVIKHKICLT